MRKIKELFNGLCKNLCDICSEFTIVLFGESIPSLAWFKNIQREHYAKDPRYAKIIVYPGKKTMFAIKNKKGKLKDVPCLIVNNRFVILDPITHKRKYAVWK